MKKKVANRKTVELEMEMEKYREEYKTWKIKNITTKTGFFPIFNTFKHTHLSEISGGALKAYLYFGIHSNNSTGECWHSVETMSDFFGVDIRTIKKWIAELEERRLVFRIQKGYKRVANTFLIPYEYDSSEDPFKKI